MQTPPRTPAIALPLLAVAFLVSASGLPAQRIPGPNEDGPAARSTAEDALRPDTVLTLPGGPHLIRLASPTTGLTALRVSIPVAERPTEAGAAMVLELLGLDRARNAARLIGARVEGNRTPWGIAYTVVGASEDFDYLAFVLRQAIAEPRPDPVEFERTRQRVLEEAYRQRETAAGRLVADLRAALFPTVPPLPGTPASLATLSPDRLLDLWTRTHRRESMSLVLGGDEPLELVLAALQGIGSNPSGFAPDPPPSAPAPEPPRRAPAQVLRQWYGEARVVGDVRDPHGGVLAELLARRLRSEDAAFESEVQLWDIGEVRVLALSGAAYRAGAPAMRRRLQDVVRQEADGMDAEAIASAVAALRFGLLEAARTPWGLVAQVGRYHDATGDPEGAYAQVRALADVTPESLKRQIETLLRTAPTRAEVRP